MAPFFHGVEVVESEAGLRPIQVSETAIVGAVGSAPGAPPDFLHTPRIIRTREDLGVLGESGHLPRAIEAIWRQAEVPVVAVVVPQPAEAAAAELTFGAGNAAIKLVADRAGAAGDDITITIVAAGNALAVAAADNDITVTPAAASTAAQVIAAINAQAAASALVAASNGDGSDGSAQVAALGQEHLVGGVDEVLLVEAVGTMVGRTGAFALLSAESRVGLRPRILCAPGFPAESDIADALATVADGLLAFGAVDGPDTDDAAALAYRATLDSDRLVMVDPSVVTPSGEVVSGSAFHAGTTAASDLDRGWWASPSNRPVRGISRLTRDVDYGGTNSRAHILNAADITTFARPGGGFRLWGNRTLSSDPKWKFLSVRRTADQIEEAMLRSHLWAVDRGITRAYFTEVAESINAFLRQLRADGAIVDGRAWADSERNTPAAIANGEVHFAFDFTPTYPSEHITFTSMLTDEYLTQLVAA